MKSKNDETEMMSELSKGKRRICARAREEDIKCNDVKRIKRKIHEHKLLCKTQENKNIYLKYV